MNEKRKARLINIARSLHHKKSGPNFHVSFILNKNQLLCLGVNNYNKSHPKHKMGQYYSRKGNGDLYEACIHSEVAAMKLFVSKFGHLDLSGLTLFNVRLGVNGEPMMSAPCKNCAKLLGAAGCNDLIHT